MTTRSQRIIDTLLPNARPWADACFAALNAHAAASGHTVEYLSGTRTFTQQAALWAQGRTTPGKRVTNSRPGSSYHNYGVAWDIGVFKDGHYLGNSPLYDQLGRIGEALGLEWGGRWHSIHDGPHYQVNTGKTVQQLMALHRADKPIPVPIYRP